MCTYSGSPNKVGLCGSLYYSSTFFGFQVEGGSASMFYTCGPNEAMVVSGKIVFSSYVYNTITRSVSFVK